MSSSPEGTQVEVAPQTSGGGRSPSRAVWAAVSGVAVALAVLLDKPAYHWALDFGARCEESLLSYFRLSRTFGGLSLWLLVALAASLMFQDRSSAASRIGSVPAAKLPRPIALASAILGSVLVSGLGSVVIKTLVRRERPRAHGGEYWFRPWFDDVGSRSGFGMPSGEAAVACAGVFVLYRICPRAWPAWLVVAAGCGFQRMVVGAHFLSDVVVSAVIGCLSASLVWRAMERHEGLPPSPGAGGARPRGLVLAAGLIALVLVSLDRSHAWQPAHPEDVRGVFATLESSTREVYLELRQDGTYARAELQGGSDPSVQLESGSWSFESDGLSFDDGPTLETLASDKLLRVEEERGLLYLFRQGRASGSS